MKTRKRQPGNGRYAGQPATFPQGFAWGAATASYQVEGAAREDGRGPSVWDMLCRKPGAVWHGHTGDVASDHYHRWQEDVGLMKQMGLNAYRMSISWSRVIPQGTGAVNPKGIAFYDRLFDSLLAEGIKPYVTLFHWDMPLALYERGGWLNPDSSKWFADYAAILARHYSDRVQDWMTLNEPQVYIGLGHSEGTHAPGDKLAWGQVLTASHHTLVAHGKAVQALRAGSKQKCRIGIAPVGHAMIPLTDDPRDVEAARRATFSVTDKSTWNNTWWMDPVFKGCYPKDGLNLYEADMPAVSREDMKTICQPLDFLGLNNYQGSMVRRSADGGVEQVDYSMTHPLTSFKWYVTPKSLYWSPKFFYERYGKPIYITENGLSCADWISLDGAVHDPNRIDFTTRYLGSLKKAALDGIDVRGYFHWSLMDNFEWAEGYSQRFGLIYVDYETGSRVLKDSARFYREVIRDNGASIPV